MTVHPVPRSICLLRLSALGDATHMLPLVRALQRGCPDAALTWVIGKGEAKMLEGLDGVELVVFDKSAGLAAWKRLREKMADRRFDALLHMQLSLRAALASTAIRAKRRIGYDHGRSKEGHSLFIDERIPPGGHHVLDAFQQFLLPLGLQPGVIEWRMPVPDAARAWAAEHVPGDRPTLLVSPCSSHPLRNWNPERYAAVADHAAAQGWRVVICGGRSELERRTADAIVAKMQAPALDLVGKDTLKQLLALLERATLVLTPDSGPAQMANAMGTAVLGLYACTDGMRSGPYSDMRWTVNRYPQAAEAFLNRPVEQVAWGRRIEFPGVMDLVTVEDAIGRFEAFRAEYPGAAQAPAR